MFGAPGIAKRNQYVGKCVLHCKSAIHRNMYVIGKIRWIGNLEHSQTHSGEESSSSEHLKNACSVEIEFIYKMHCGL